MKAKVKLKIKYEGPITFSKETFVDYNNINGSPNSFNWLWTQSIFTEYKNFKSKFYLLE